MYNILIVEDEEIERTVLKSVMLDNIKDIHIVGEAENGRQAIDIIDNNEIDLAFMDINLPGINGLEVINHLKEKSPDSKVIIVTAYDRFEIAHAAIKLKVDDYLLKPVRHGVLIKTVKKYIDETSKGRILNEYHSYLTRLRETIHDNCYKASIDIVKDYIYEVYDSVDFNDIVTDALKLLGDELIDISKDMDIKATDKIENNLNRIINSNLHSKEQYKLYCELKEIISQLYLELDSKKENAGKDMNSFKNYIEINIKNGITLEDLANYSNRNIYYLSKLFKKEMGVNFIDYLTDRKIQLAKEMLEDTNIPIKNISIELSFNEPNYFSKVFKKNVGITPSQYREKVSII